MPRNSSIEANTTENASMLLQALGRYYSHKSSGASEGRDNELIGKTSLSLASSLMEDYRANGLYVRRKKHHTLNQGRADWKKTIFRLTPYPSNDTPIYLDTVTSSTRYVSDCETARIHSHVLKDIQQKYGALLSAQVDCTNDRLERMPEPIPSLEGQLAALDKELSASYSERDIQLIGMLQNYIEDKIATEGAELLVGTRKFHNVWEGMLDKCLPGKKEINSQLPVPYYQQGEYFIEVPRKGQKTDTVIENEDKSRWAVIDAKYYDASSPISAPGWHDLVKQYFYKTAAEKVCENSVSISLHFIFPGTKHHLNNAKVGERGQKKVSFPKFKEVEGYGEILCHYCDPIVLIRKYTNSLKLNITDDNDIIGKLFPPVENSETV